MSIPEITLLFFGSGKPNYDKFLPLVDLHQDQKQFLGLIIRDRSFYLVPSVKCSKISCFFDFLVFNPKYLLYLSIVRLVILVIYALDCQDSFDIQFVVVFQ